MAGLKTYQTGEILFREGEAGQSVFFIMSGQVRVTKALKNGSAQELAILGEDDIVGEMAVLYEGPRSATVTALEPTDVMEVEKANFFASLEQQPQLAIKFLRLLAERIEQMNEKFKLALFKQTKI